MFRTVVRTVLALLLSNALAGASRAGFIFQTPSGISPGQSFNVVFFDSIGDTATSANIADYNAAITSAASNILYPGGAIGSWSIIGATPTADGAAALFSSNLPVYDLHGTFLATTGVSYQSTGPAPFIDQTGAEFPVYPAWTGLIALGIPAIPLYNLGGGGAFPSYGLSSYPPPADGWGGQLGHAPTDTLALYGYAVFTAGNPAVPEPSSLALAFVGLVCATFARAMRRRGAAMPRPTGCPPTHL
jgi:hypothetical protein